MDRESETVREFENRLVGKSLEVEGEWYLLENEGIALWVPECQQMGEETARAYRDAGYTLTPVTVTRKI